MKARINIRFVFLMMFLYSTFITFAAAPPPPPPPPPGCWPPPCIPIDGGVSILLAAGALYGAKKSYDKLRTRKDKGEADNTR